MLSLGLPVDVKSAITSTFSPTTSPLSRLLRKSDLQTLMFIRSSRISHSALSSHVIEIRYFLSVSSSKPMGLILRAKGRSIKFEVIRTAVAIIAKIYLLVEDRMPIAAVHHKVAAVLIPFTDAFSLKMTPLHKKPTPEIILLPTRNT